MGCSFEGIRNKIYIEPVSVKTGLNDIIIIIIIIQKENCNHWKAIAFSFCFLKFERVINCIIVSASQYN